MVLVTNPDPDSSPDPSPEPLLSANTSGTFRLLKGAPEDDDAALVSVAEPEVVEAVAYGPNISSSPDPEADVSLLRKPKVETAWSAALEVERWSGVTPGRASLGAEVELDRGLCVAG